MDLPVAVFSPFGSKLFCNKLPKRIINSKENVGKATNPLRFYSFFFAPPAASLSPRIKEMGEGRGKGKLFSSFLGGRRKRGEGGNCHHSSLNSKRKGGKRGGGKKELRYVLVSGTAAAGYGKKLLRRGEGDQEKRIHGQRTLSYFSFS